MTTQLKTVPRIEPGDLAEIGGHDEKTFGYYLFVESVQGDIYTGTLQVPGGERLSIHRDDLVGCFRRIDLNV